MTPPFRCSPEKWGRLIDAYRQMAALGYRPGAPSDGLGNITVPIEELDLDAEAAAYVQRFLAEEDADRYWIGNPDFRANRAFIWTLEALKLMCTGMGHEANERAWKLRNIPKLLDMAAREYVEEMIKAG